MSLWPLFIIFILDTIKACKARLRQQLSAFKRRIIHLNRTLSIHPRLLSLSISSQVLVPTDDLSLLCIRVCIQNILNMRNLKSRLLRHILLHPKQSNDLITVCRKETQKRGVLDQLDVVNLSFFSCYPDFWSHAVTCKDNLYAFRWESY